MGSAGFLPTLTRTFPLVLSCQCDFLCSDRTILIKILILYGVNFRGISTNLTKIPWSLWVYQFDMCLVNPGLLWHLS